MHAQFAALDAFGPSPLTPRVHSEVKRSSSTELLLVTDVISPALDEGVNVGQ